MADKNLKVKKSLLADEKNKNLCHQCDKCCKYIAVEIDKPTDKSDFDNIFWFLHHKNVRVYVGHDNGWYVEFITPCKELSASGLCKIYEKRPQICRDYTQKDCPKYTDEPAEKFYFQSVGDLEKYLEKKRVN